jgi:hypothetical protein
MSPDQFPPVVPENPIRAMRAIRQNQGRPRVNTDGTVTTIIGEG